MFRQAAALLFSTLAILGLMQSQLTAQAVVGSLPTAALPTVRPLSDVPVLTVPALDLEAIAREDELRQSQGLAPRYAIPNAVEVSTDSHGLWEAVDDAHLLWRLRIKAPKAASINLGFTQYSMPAGGRLLVYTTDQKGVLGPFTDADNESHGELWTPVVLTGEVVIEVTIPNVGMNTLALSLTHVGSGYRGFGVKSGGGQKSGSCNVDVVCPEGVGWESEVASVGVISTGGSLFCTGYMVNNTANDRTPYFMTAKHCGISSGSAASLVVYWNYETTVCGGSPNGVLTDWQSGSFYRSSYTASDFTLVELDSDPLSGWEVTFAGWDRTGAEASTAVAIHHPNTDEKRISFEFQSTRTTSYLGNSSPGDGTHVKVIDWDIGTTEPGSSGSPLFDQDHRIIGQLHGGYAACGNNSADWYGRFSRSWTGGGGNSTRLSNWLDAGNTGATTVDTLGNGLSISPSGPVAHDGPILGPFANPSTTYTLTNQTTLPLSYRVSLDGAVGLLLDGGAGPVTGTLSASGSAQFQITLGSAVELLGVGQYLENVQVDDLTNLFTVDIPHTFMIGSGVAANFPLDSNPGWSTEGQWAFGVPTGSGGATYGLPDPSSGNTGANVYGYNLTGNYANNLPQRHLVTTPIDCSNLTGAELIFYRWLNVEQPAYDHAKLSISVNGFGWTTLWENSAEITESSWSEQRFDISGVADGQPTVYLRWTMGTTDGSWDYSGWNIDDIRIEGVGSFTAYGAGCAGAGGQVPELSGSGNASPGGSVTIQVQNARPSGSGLMFLSLTPGNTPVSGCTYLLGASLVPPVGIGLDGAGAASIPATLPAGFPSGLGIFMQFLSLDPGAANGRWATSNGMEMLVQ